YTSAIDEFNSVLGGLRQYEAETAGADDHFGSISISPTLVDAGTFHNVVPPVCEATFDIRLPPNKASSEVKDQIRKIVSNSLHEKSTASFEFDEPTEAYEADPNSDLVRAFQRDIIVKLGSRPVFVRKTSTSDMNT